MDAKRLFIALTLPEPVRATLAREAHPLPGVTWSRPEKLHVTIRFLGDVAVEQIPAILERLRQVKVGPFI
ncbi:MAG: 2'-5' RNA ligase family protein, partial [Verrucomicrobiota bacterium]